MINYYCIQPNVFEDDNLEDDNVKNKERIILQNYKCQLLSVLLSQISRKGAIYDYNGVLFGQKGEINDIINNLSTQHKVKVKHKLMRLKKDNKIIDLKDYFNIDSFGDVECAKCGNENNKCNIDKMIRTIDSDLISIKDSKCNCIGSIDNKTIGIESFLENNNKNCLIIFKYNDTENGEQSVEDFTNQFLKPAFKWATNIKMVEPQLIGKLNEVKFLNASDEDVEKKCRQIINGKKNYMKSFEKLFEIIDKVGLSKNRKTVTIYTKLDFFAINKDWRIQWIKDNVEKIQDINRINAGIRNLKIIKRVLELLEDEFKVITNHLNIECRIKVMERESALHDRFLITDHYQFQLGRGFDLFTGDLINDTTISILDSDDNQLCKYIDGQLDIMERIDNVIGYYDDQKSEIETQ